MDDVGCLKKGSVPAFYHNSTILVTGATGFMGMVLLEKLLRSCAQLRRIYLLMRDKKSKSIDQRFEELFNDQLFAVMKQQCPKYREKLAPVSGDCMLPGLGLGEADHQLLQREVDIVFHCAASVRFDETLRSATAVNVRAVSYLLKLAMGMQHLKAMVHVSTAFANCPWKKVEERFYELPLSSEKLLALVDVLDDADLHKITPLVLKPWPNTYSFTKAIGEDVIRREGKGLPLCIVRPSMVMCTALEPVPGWTNNVNGPAGVILGAGVGLLRTVNVDTAMIADLVPVDMLINATLVAAWDVASKRSILLSASESRDDVEKNQVTKELDDDQEVPIYNFVSSARKPLTWRMFMKYNESGIQYPSEHCMWYYFMFITKRLWVHKIARIFLHLLPALIVDTACICVGKKPMLLKAYKKIHKFLEVTSYFSHREWDFTDRNVQHLWSSLSDNDREMFPFNIEKINWEETLSHMIPGLRVYFLKDPMDTVNQAKLKYRRLRVMHYSLVAALWLLVFRMLWWLISFFV